jgi:hypothetical protein
MSFGGFNHNFTVSLSSPSTQVVTVGYTTNDGTAVSGSDYIDNDSILTFQPGETTKSISVRVSGDRIPEPDEFFTVSLNSASNANIDNTRNLATGRILDDDNIAVVSATSANLSFNEGNSPTLPRYASIAIEVSRLVDRGVTVNYSIIPGTATAGSDYTGTGGSLVFSSTQTLRYISVPIIGDTIPETNETFTVRLNSVTNAIINPDFTNTIGNILNDDGPLPLGVSSSIHQDSLINNDAGNISPVARQSTSGLQTNTNLGSITNGQNSAIDSSVFNNSQPLDILSPNNRDITNLLPNQSTFF